jgi:hypothetical protein
LSQGKSRSGVTINDGRFPKIAQQLHSCAAASFYSQPRGGAAAKYERHDDACAMETGGRTVSCTHDIAIRQMAPQRHFRPTSPGIALSISTVISGDRHAELKRKTSDKLELRYRMINDETRRNAA